jgi:murein DD-endopeptidase MepM/ murein hydrolase activator NlpD
MFTKLFSLGVAWVYTRLVVRKFLFCLVLMLGLFGVAQVSAFRSPLELIPLNSPKTVRLQAKRPEASSVVIYLRVRRGDSIGSIANRFRVTPRAIKLETGITKNTILPGEILKVPLKKADLEPTRVARLPPGAFWYTVRRGDTLSTIQSRYDFTQMDLVNANPALRSLDQIRLGERLIIPGYSYGAYLVLKEGQDLMGVAADYGVEIDDLIRANNAGQVGALRVGDYVVLPGVDANATLKRLEDRRDAEEAVRIQKRFELAKVRIAEARAEIALQAKSRAAARLVAQTQASKARERLRVAQRTSSSQVRRATASFSSPTFRGGYIWPMRGTITSSFGRRGFWIGSSNFHTGLDIAAPYGTPIYAAKGGLVQQSGYGYYGLNVWISTGSGVQNIYGHMSRTAVYSGQYVERGQLIGWEGCSGICTGPHLHFEIRVNGSPVNPLRYLP